MGPRPRHPRCCPAAARAAAPLRRHLRCPDAVPPVAGRTYAPLRRLSRPSHARPRDRRPGPGRAPSAGTGEPHQPLPRACHRPRRTLAAEHERAADPSQTQQPARLRPGTRVRPGWPQICGPTESKRLKVLIPPPHRASSRVPDRSGSRRSPHLCYDDLGGVVAEESCAVTWPAASRPDAIAPSM
jgi:hypothetical protein